MTHGLDDGGPDVLAAYAASVQPVYAQFPSASGVPTRTTADEMVDASHAMRPYWRGVGEVVSALGTAGLNDRRAAIARLLEDDGVTYRAVDDDADQPWTLDPIPLLIDEPEWVGLEAALMQRAELLDAVLTDLYGERSLLRDKVIPAPVVFGHAGFVRQADRIRIPGPRQLFLHSTDLARDADGRLRVLGDRTQAPSGVGYAMENRSVLSRAMPGLYRDTAVHRIAPFYRTMRQALQRLAPKSSQHSVAPRVVLLSPGSSSETAFDQAFLSSLLGLPLVVGSDLAVRDGRVWHRSLNGFEQVDVILRRVDADFCDPLDLRGDSQLGVPGLLEAARAGSVAIVNSLGAGVLENPGLVPFLPDICRRLRDEDLLIDSAETFWCGDPVARQHVLTNLDRLVVKSIARHVGQTSRFGWELSAAQRDALVRRIEAEPYAWVGQEALSMSTAPTLRDRSLQPRSVVLRTFAVADGEQYQLMPGGLTRAALAPDSLLVSNANGAVSKDVWVLSSSAESGEETMTQVLIGPETVSAAVSPRVAEDLFWLGRYTERAEGVTRLLRVVDNRWRDLHPAPEPALAGCLVTLLETLTSITATLPGFIGEGSAARLANPDMEILSLIGDERRIGSLAHDLGRIRALANTVRDQLSTDTWAVLSGLDRGMQPFTIAAHLDGPTRRRMRSESETSERLTQVLQATLSFSGLVAESMVRDTGWYMLDAGRRLERALQITSLLRYALVKDHPAAMQQLVIESVLIAAESIITHRRRYPARSGVESVLELLLGDEGNPRAVAFQLVRLEENLEHTPSTEHTLGQARKLAHTVCERLQHTDLVGLVGVDGGARPVLAEFLDGVIDDLRQLYHLISSAHFVQPAALQPLEGVGGAEMEAAS